MFKFNRHGDIRLAVVEAERELQRALAHIQRPPEARTGAEEALRRAQTRVEALWREVQIREALSNAAQGLTVARYHARRGDFTAAREAIKSVRAELDRALVVLRSGQDRQPSSEQAGQPGAKASVAPDRHAALEAVRQELLAGVLDPLTRGDVAAATAKLQALEARLKALGAERVPEPMRQSVQEVQVKAGQAAEAVSKRRFLKAAQLLAAAATGLGHGLEAALARKQHKDAAAAFGR